ncbi:MAG: NTP transferase domain-containing protein [Bacteroidota bacterium]|nr:NTP transferase domain-containing protein [Bacteroidota bacterium]
MDVKNKYSAIILMAGKSARLGQPKAWLSFDPEFNFIQNLVYQYTQAGIENIVLVTHSQLIKQLKKQIHENLNANSIKIVCNIRPVSDRFYSIKLGLNNIDNSFPVFIQNIDNPFTTSGLLNQMKAKIEPGKYVVPVYLGKKGHPVLLSKEILQHIKEIKSDSEDLRVILEKFSFEEVPVDDEKLLANINTEEDYIKYFNHAIPV